MRKIKRKTSTTDLQYLTRFMSGLLPDQKRLTEIQSVYDNLTLLGQLLGAGTDITRMRNDFTQLASLLLEQLAREHYKKAALNLNSSAQVAIDVLTRNLYERTADIGFLATDSVIREFAEQVSTDPDQRDSRAWQSRLQTRFTEYVNKYSVYHNIVILSPAGTVLAQLDQNNPVTLVNDPFLEDALTTQAGYTEIFRPTDLLPGEDSPLVYAYRIMSTDGSHPVGVLCLCFRFQDECQRIFDSLVAEDDWTVLTMLDNSGRIIASSDRLQFPVGVRIEPAEGGDCKVIRSSGREYLAISHRAHGYQGYMGPGWFGHAMAPLNHAFEMSEAHELEDVPDDLLHCVLETASLFSQKLRDIPLKASSIQQELNRSVWNGHIWLAGDNAAHNAEFAKVLLREIGSTGIRTRNVYSESTTNLYKTIVASVLFECSTHAALAIDIMDRNLYERANDCRWWALTPTFREELTRIDLQDSAQRERLVDVLRTINALYTVYENLILFDATGRVTAVSNPAYNDLIGQPLQEDWVRPTLGLRDDQSFHVSRFAPSRVYADRPTLVYSAAVRVAEGNDPVGGIAIVFDAGPQFQAMLQDSLPYETDGTLPEGAFAVFVERNGLLISSTDPTLAPGQKMDFPPAFARLHPGESRSMIIEYAGKYYAVGGCMRAGYREYNSTPGERATDVMALVFSPLSDRLIPGNRLPRPETAANGIYALRQIKTGETLDIASFYIGHHWYGLRSTWIVEAVDAERITSIPGSASWIRGYLIYKDKALTVYDASGILDTLKPEAERRMSPQGSVSRTQVLVLRGEPGQPLFGMVVDSLGDIAEIPVARIQQDPGMANARGSVVDSIVKPMDNDPERRLMLILAVPRLLEQLSGTGTRLRYG